jgi:hypothetical protein
MSTLQAEVAQGGTLAAEPSGYEATTPVYKRYVSPQLYARFSPEVQKWYRPYWTPAREQVSIEPLGYAQIGLLNGRSYLRMVYDREPYPPPASVARNLNLVPVFGVAPAQAQVLAEVLGKLSQIVDMHGHWTNGMHAARLAREARAALVAAGAAS